MAPGSGCGAGGRVGRADLVLGVAALVLGLVVGSGLLLALTLAATIVAPFGLALMPVLMLGLWASLRRRSSSASGRDRMELLAGGRPSSRGADRVEIEHVAGRRRAA